MPTIQFHDGFNGTYDIGGQHLIIGKDGLKPYDMTYGAIVSCLWATFLDLAKRMELSVDGAEITIEGHKRKEIPATLERVIIHVKAQSQASQQQLDLCLQKALKYCSMVQTVSKVAAVEADITKA